MPIVETMLLSTIVGVMCYEVYRCISFRRTMPTPTENIMIPVRHIYSYDPDIVGLCVYSVNMNDIAPLKIQKDSCPICLEDVDKIRKTYCNHSFCDDCLTKWIKKSTRCPLCNQDMITH